MRRRAILTHPAVHRPQAIISSTTKLSKSNLLAKDDVTKAVNSHFKDNVRAEFTKTSNGRVAECKCARLRSTVLRKPILKIRS